MAHHALLLVLAASTVVLALAQSCYYPDGSLTTADAPCPNSALCCPLNWRCLSNGLCYDPTNNYIQRRTCTDRTWQDADCPNFCTYSETGNEAILRCGSGKYCCNGNGDSFDCCDGTLPPGTDYFNLPAGNVIGEVSEMGPAPTSNGASGADLSSVTSDEATTRSSSPPADTTSSSLPPFAFGSSSYDSTTMRAASETGGGTASRPSSSTLSVAGATEAVDTSSATGSAISKPDNEPPDDKSFGSGAIIGLAIGVSVLLILCALISFFLWRRHRKSKIPRLATYHHEPVSPTDMKYSDATPREPPASEIDSSPKAFTDRTSELYGSDPPYMRHSMVSSTTAGAQGYSPTSKVSPVVSSGEGSAYGTAGGMGQIEEKDEPAPVELWGGPTYTPYRPRLENRGQGVDDQAQGQEPDSGDVQP